MSQLFISHLNSSCLSKIKDLVSKSVLELVNMMNSNSSVAIDILDKVYIDTIDSGLIMINNFYVDVIENSLQPVFNIYNCNVRVTKLALHLTGNNII